MSDVNVLRALADCDGRAGEPLGKAMRSAADEIERLQAELREAREVMRDIVDGWDWWRADEYDRCQSVPGDAIDAARAFLAK